MQSVGTWCQLQRVSVVIGNLFALSSSKRFTILADDHYNEIKQQVVGVCRPNIAISRHKFCRLSAEVLRVS